MPENRNREAKVPFLKNIFLFSSLDQARLEQLADEMNMVTLVEGESLYSEGEEANYFYIVFEGKLRLKTGRGKQKREWDTLIKGDYFGVDLVFDLVYSETAYAVEPSRVLRLGRAPFLALLAEYPDIKTFITRTAQSRRMARRFQIKLLGEDEAIYTIIRKHDFFLVVSLIFPIILAIASIPFLVFGFASIGTAAGSSLFWILGILLALAAIVLGFWFYIDWRNDYYIVTSQRVMWFEKVIFLYDSTQEAPLSTILAKDVVFNQVLRYFIDYGTVIIRTFTGSIVMRRADRPNLFVAYINGLQARARELARQAEEEKMEDLIRSRINMSPAARPVPEAPPAEEGSTSLIRGKTPLEKIFTNSLKLRYEVGDAIIYRKHWLVLLRKIGLELVVFIGVFALLVLLSILFPGNVLTSAVALIFGWVPILLVVFIWGLYHYVDWRNDVYIVTLDTIIDIERKPLSTEEKKSAPLNNILSMEYDRVGILGLLLNVGDVKINVGTTEFTFDGVYNPAQVQHEIFDRMYALRRRREEADAARERERLANIIATYHRQVETLEEPESDSDWDIFPG